MGAFWLLLGLGLVPWHCSLHRWGVDGQLFHSGGSNQVVAIAVVASLNGLPWSDHLIGVDGQLFGGGEAGFGYTDLISPRVDSDISDYYYDYQDQVSKLLFFGDVAPKKVFVSLSKWAWAVRSLLLLVSQQLFNIY